jgi:transcriptional regulator with GAF, ATPase, and Fis domain
VRSYDGSAGSLQGTAMKRRSRAGGEKAKEPRRTALKARRRAARAAPSLPAQAQETEVARLTGELTEARDQQAAASEVLRIISSSPGDLRPVFAGILENATRLCQAKFGALYLCEGEAYRTVAMHNAPPAFVEARTREPLVSMAGTTVLARVAKTKRTIQIADMAEDPAYRNNPQNTQLFVKLTGARSVVLVPMLKDEVLIGTIVIFRQEVRSFTDK